MLLGRLSAHFSSSLPILANSRRQVFSARSNLVACSFRPQASIRKERPLAAYGLAVPDWVRGGGLGRGPPRLGAG
jgi:hypothetical protein